jgi:hypothetical protein
LFDLKPSFGRKHTFISGKTLEPEQQAQVEFLVTWAASNRIRCQKIQTNNSI